MGKLVIEAIRFPATFIALAVAVMVWIAAIIWNIDVLKMPFGFLERIERTETDEIATSFLLVILGFAIDQIIEGRRAKSRSRTNDERLRVVRVTMTTVEDIVNNCLNQLQLLRFDAEGQVPEESLQIFDQAIQDTAGKLRALGDLKVYTEKKMAVGMGIGFR